MAAYKRSTYYISAYLGSSMGYTYEVAATGDKLKDLLTTAYVHRIDVNGDIKQRWPLSNLDAPFHASAKKYIYTCMKIRERDELNRTLALE